MDAPSERNLAFVAFLVLLTSLWLPWWHADVTDSEGAGGSLSYRPFVPMEPDTSPWVPWAVPFILLAAAGLVFVRLAARSWKHEPPAWRRDLWIGAGITATGVGLAFGWPGDTPVVFWGRRAVYDEFGTQLTAVGMPGVGWWAAALAAVALGVAAWMARRPTTGK